MWLKGPPPLESFIVLSNNQTYVLKHFNFCLPHYVFLSDLHLIENVTEGNTLLAKSVALLFCCIVSRFGQIKQSNMSKSNKTKCLIWAKSHKNTEKHLMGEGH